MICTISSNQKEKDWVCKNEHEMPYIGLKQVLIEILWRLYQGGYTDFCVNCDYGVPLWAAEVICAMKQYHSIHLHLVIPFEEQSTNWPEALRDRYFAVHEKADTVVFARNHPEEDCWEEADRRMVKCSDLVFLFAEDSDCLYIADHAKECGVKVIYACSALSE